MPLSDVVNISISVSASSPAGNGFGVPLILSHSASWTERTRSYTSLAGVLADFAITTPEYKAAAKIFAQNPRPPVVKIGRAALKPTLAWKITIAQVLSSTVYSVVIGGVTFSITSDGSATNDEIADALAAAITGVTGFAAASAGSGGSKYVTVTASAPGNWTSLKTADPSLLEVIQTAADPGIATDLAAIDLADPDWYMLISLFNSPAIVAAAAAWIETAKKLYVVQVQDSGVESHAENTSASDVAHTLAAAAYARTAIFFGRDNGQFIDAAEVGRCAPFTPGKETWALKTLATVTPDDYTSTQQTNIEAKHANYYATSRGRAVTYKGTVADGEYIDVIRFIDWLRVTMDQNTFDLLSDGSLGKIPFTDDGITAIQGVVLGTLKQGIANGGLAKDPAPVVIVPRAADVSGAHKTARNLPGVEFSAPLAGAIHATAVTGRVTQ